MLRYEEMMEKIITSHENDWLYDGDFDIYTFKGDISITIQEDLEFGRDPYTENWMHNFPETSGYKNRFIIKYNNSFVTSFTLVGVDSYRACLPTPSRDLKITNEAYHLARIINGPFPGDEYESYFVKSGFSLK